MNAYRLKCNDSIKPFLLFDQTFFYFYHNNSLSVFIISEREEFAFRFIYGLHFHPAKENEIFFCNARDEN